MFIRPYVNICGKNYVVMPVILWVFGKFPGPPCTIFNVLANNHSPNDPRQYYPWDKNGDNIRTGGFSENVHANLILALQRPGAACKNNPPWVLPGTVVWANVYSPLRYHLWINRWEYLIFIYRHIPIYASAPSREMIFFSQSRKEKHHSLCASAPSREIIFPGWQPTEDMP